MNATQFFIQQQLAKAESNASSALSQLRTAKTIEQIVRASHVDIPGTVRALKHMVHSLKAVERLAEERIESLIDEQVKAIHAAATPEEAEALANSFMRRQVPALRGRFSRQYQYAERALRQALAARST
ncbi:MAG: hypothetical protein OEL20_04880 [Sulfuritalea sp.]|nr:hypothetical protein [Sulfuritalea sp.]